MSTSCIADGAWLRARLHCSLIFHVPYTAGRSAVGLPAEAAVALLTLASTCDDSLLPRLLSNTSLACARLAAAVSSITDDVLQRAPGFAANASRRLRTVDKVLKLKEEELSDTLKLLGCYLQQSSAAGGDASLEQSMEVLNRVLAGTDALSPRSMLLFPVCVDDAMV